MCSYKCMELRGRVKEKEQKSKGKGMCMIKGKVLLIPNSTSYQKLTYFGASKT